MAAGGGAPEALVPRGGHRSSFFGSVARYCIRVLQQAELQQQQQQQQSGGMTAAAAATTGRAKGGLLGDSSSSSSSYLRLGRHSFVETGALEIELLDAAALEAVRLLFLISPADRNIHQQAYAAIKRVDPKP